MRRRSTPAEDRLWQALRRSQVEGRKFRRQHSIGPFIVDFYCPAERLAVEVDGPVHRLPRVREKDARRTRYLTTRNIRVIRFENWQVYEQLDLVLQEIAATFGSEAGVAPPTP